MCSSPKVPKIEAPQTQELQPLPDPKPLPTVQQAAPPPALAPVTPVQSMPFAPPAPRVDLQEQTPLPVMAQNAEDIPIVRRRKTKRDELQQANQGAGALTIDSTAALGQGSGNTGASGLNIPN